MLMFFVFAFDQVFGVWAYTFLPQTFIFVLCFFPPRSCWIFPPRNDLSPSDRFFDWASICADLLLFPASIALNFSPPQGPQPFRSIFRASIFVDLCFLSASSVAVFSSRKGLCPSDRFFEPLYLLIFVFFRLDCSWFFLPRNPTTASIGKNSRKIPGAFSHQLKVGETRAAAAPVFVGVFCLFALFLRIYIYIYIIHQNVSYNMVCADMCAVVAR